MFQKNHSSCCAEAETRQNTSVVFQGRDDVDWIGSCARGGKNQILKNIMKVNLRRSMDIKFEMPIRHVSGDFRRVSNL